MNSICILKHVSYNGACYITNFDFWISEIHGYTSMEAECDKYQYLCQCAEGYKLQDNQCRKCKLNHHIMCWGLQVIR